MIETLESRIAPAAILTATLVGAKLTITGTAEAETGGFGNSGDGSSFQISTQPGTNLIFNGTDLGDGASMDLGRPVMDLTVDLGAGDDSIECDFSTFAKSLTIKGGAGKDSIKLVGISTGGAISIDAGADDDNVKIEANTHASKIDVNLGEGSNALELNNTDLFVEKSVTVKAGAGNDSLTTNNTASCGFRIGGDFAIALGKGDNQVNLGHPADTVGMLDVGGKLSIVQDVHASTVPINLYTYNMRVGGEFSVTNAGTGDATVEVNSGNVHITGKTTVKSAGDAADSVRFDAGQLLLTGPVSFDLGGGANATTFNGATATALGSLAYKGGAGQDTITFLSGVPVVVTGLTDLKLGDGDNQVTDDNFNITSSGLVFGGGLSLTSGSGADTLKLKTYEITVGGKGVKLATGTGDDTVTLASADVLSINGSFSAAIGGGTSSVGISSPILTVRSGFSTAFGDGAGTFTLGGVVDIGGGLSLSAKGGGTDHFTLGFDRLSVRGAVSFTGDAGTLDVTVTTASQGFRFGALAYATKAGGGTLDIESGGEIFGDFNFKGGAGSNTLTTGKTGYPALNIYGNANITSSTTTGTELVQFAQATVAGTFTAKLGAANSQVELDDTKFGGAVSIDTGVGNDTIKAQLSSTFTGSVLFRLPFKFTLGAGDDTVSLGNTGGVVFAGNAAALAKVLIDGGAGTDTFNSTNFSDGMSFLTAPTKNIETTTP